MSWLVSARTKSFSETRGFFCFRTICILEITLTMTFDGTDLQFGPKNG
jgi:hypothetical protein